MPAMRGTPGPAEAEEETGEGRPAEGGGGSVLRGRPKLGLPEDIGKDVPWLRRGSGSNREGLRPPIPARSQWVVEAMILRPPSLATNCHNSRTDPSGLRGPAHAQPDRPRCLPFTEPGSRGARIPPPRSVP